jgi:predicted ThiF/HesA family dinucleotide-utilizing enzyme
LVHAPRASLSLCGISRSTMRQYLRVFQSLSQGGMRILS